MLFASYTIFSTLSSILKEENNTINLTFNQRYGNNIPFRCIALLRARTPENVALKLHFDAFGGTII